MFVHIQETRILFWEMELLSQREPSDEKTKLIDLLLECNFVELIQKMWRKNLSQELLEQKTVLPDYLSSSLAVNTLFCIMQCCTLVYTFASANDEVLKNTAAPGSQFVEC